MVSIIDINPEVETLFQQRSFNQQVEALINYTIGDKKLTIEEIELTRTLTTGQKAFLANITLAAPLDNATENAVEWNILTQTGAGGGTNNHLNQGFVINLLAGFDGIRNTLGLSVNNLVGSGVGSVISISGNKAIQGFSSGVTATGHNIGAEGRASNALRNFGVRGSAVVSTSGSTNIGVFGYADYTGVTANRIGVYAFLGSSNPAFNVDAALVANTGNRITDRIASFQEASVEYLAIHPKGVIAKNISSPAYEIDWETPTYSGITSAWRLRRSDASMGGALRVLSTGLSLEFFDTFILQNSNNYSGIGSNAGTNILGINTSSDLNIVSGRKVTFGASTATSAASSGRFNFLTGSSGTMGSYLFIRTNTSVAYQGGILLGNQDSNVSGSSSYKFSSSFSGTLNAFLKISLVENSATETDLNRIFLNRGTNGRDMIFGSDSNVGNISFWGANSAHWGSGRGTLFFKFVTTTPTSSPSGGNLIYNDNGVMKYIDPNGFTIAW